MDEREKIIADLIVSLEHATGAYKAYLAYCEEVGWRGDYVDFINNNVDPVNLEANVGGAYRKLQSTLDALKDTTK